MNKIVKNDQVIVITGKDKGNIGTVTQVLSNGKLLVSGINLYTKNQKANPQAGVTGGQVKKEMPIHASNVKLVNPATNKGDRVGFDRPENGKGFRVFKSNNEAVS